MENEKNKLGIKSNTHAFSIADADYFYSDENEGDLIKAYIIKKIFIFAASSLAVLGIFIVTYFYYEF